MHVLRRRLDRKVCGQKQIGSYVFIFDGRVARICAILEDSLLILRGIDTNSPLLLQSFYTRFAGYTYRDVAPYVKVLGGAVNMNMLFESSLIKIEIIKIGVTEFDPPLVHKQAFIHYGNMSPLLQIYVLVPQLSLHFRVLSPGLHL